MPPTNLDEFLKDTQGLVLDHLRSNRTPTHFKPADLERVAWSYVERPAKRLRPAVLLMAAGSVGGKAAVHRAVPAAAGVEIFHTWTLVHDDLIDNDRLRRGAPTVHEAIERQCRDSGDWTAAAGAEYARDIAILTGDLQHGWSVTLFLDCVLRGADPSIVVDIVRRLQSQVLAELIEGEARDVDLGLRNRPWDTIDDEQIEEMLRLKTGVLYGFAGWAGAMLGLPPRPVEDPSVEDPSVAALREFASDCGTAFQLQDDILGIVGDEVTLGKPVGSDLREGKKTLIVLEALRRADGDQRRRVLSVLGNRHAGPDEIGEVTGLLRDLGGIARTQDRARDYVATAKERLKKLPPSMYRDLLEEWADHMVGRTF